MVRHSNQIGLLFPEFSSSIDDRMPAWNRKISELYLRFWFIQRQCNHHKSLQNNLCVYWTEKENNNWQFFSRCSRLRRDSQDRFGNKKRQNQTKIVVIHRCCFVFHNHIGTPTSINENQLEFIVVIVVTRSA